MTATGTLRTDAGSAIRQHPRRARPVHALHLLALAGVAAGVTGTAGPALRSACVPVQAASAPAAKRDLAAAPAAAAPLLAAATTEVARETARPSSVAETPAAARAVARFPVLGNGHPRENYYAHLRSQLRWVPVRVGRGQGATPDAGSRLLLVQSAARRAELHDFGLDFRDVYGVINAETSWVPRTGMGRNGVASHGLAQFEPATARAVGLRNPNDAVEAVHAAALHLREAASWSARRLERLNLAPEQHAQKLREGISIYYNLSSRGRRAWNGLNTHRLPVETRLHIRNVRKGMEQAEQLQARLAAGSLPPGALVTWRGPVAATGAEPGRKPGPDDRSTGRSETAPQAEQVAAARSLRVQGAAVRPLRSQGAAARPQQAPGGTAAAPRGQGTIAWSNGGGARKVWVLPTGRVASTDQRNG